MASMEDLGPVRSIPMALVKTAAYPFGGRENQAAGQIL